MCCIKKKKKTTTTTTGNSAKSMTTVHAHGTNYLITQLINKHAAYTDSVEPKLGLVVTNHIREFHSSGNLPIILCYSFTIYSEAS